MDYQEGYEVIIRSKDGVELHKGTYPLDCMIGVIKKTYPKELDGWAKSEIVFSNLTEEQINKLQEMLKERK